MSELTKIYPRSRCLATFSCLVLAATVLTSCAGRLPELRPPPPPPVVDRAPAKPLATAVAEAAAKNEAAARRRAERAAAAALAGDAARADAAAIERQLAARRPGAEAALERLLLRQLAEWEGVRYRYGGISKAGIDCSGLVVVTFHAVLGVDLPRTTRGQVQEGKSISRKKLRTGDLVFFKLKNRTRHVGIYLSDGWFMHASARRGVIKSSLESPFWAARYWQSRRLDQTARAGRRHTMAE